MDAPPRMYGPKRVPPSGQIALPRELMEALNLQEGDHVYLLAWKGRVLIVREEEVSGELEDLFRSLASGE